MIIYKARLTNMLVCVTRLGLQETCGSKNFLDTHSFDTHFYSYCPSYAYPAEQSKLLVLSSASFFNC